MCINKYLHQKCLCSQPIHELKLHHSISEGMSFVTFYQGDASNKQEGLDYCISCVFVTPTETSP